MSKEKYFGGGNCGEFMWGKGLDSPKEKRSKVWHDSDTPRFAEGGLVIPGLRSDGSFDAALKKGGKVKGRFAEGGGVSLPSSMSNVIANQEARERAIDMGMKKGGKVKGRFADGGGVSTSPMSDAMSRATANQISLGRASDMGMKKGGKVKGRFADGGSSKCSGKR